MLGEDGSIRFVTELMEIVDRFLSEYEETQGPFRNELERGLVISYILGVMRCEVDCAWDCLADAKVFGGLHPRVVFEDCVQESQNAQALRGLVESELGRRGWPR